MTNVTHNMCKGVLAVSQPQICYSYITPRIYKSRCPCGCLLEPLKFMCHLRSNHTQFRFTRHHKQTQLSLHFVLLSDRTLELLRCFANKNIQVLR